MAEAETGQMSAVRAEHAARPRRPRPASKPGTPSSATAAASGGGKGGGGGGKASAQGAGKAAQGPGKAAQGRSENASGAGESTGGSGSGMSGLGMLPKLGKVLYPHLPIWGRLALKLLERLANHELKKPAEALTKPAEALKKPAEALMKPAEALKKPGQALTKPAEALEKTRGGIEFGGLKPGLPVQEAVDIAVPLGFAWQRWMELGFLPEGVDRVVDIARDGSQLEGRLDGESGSDWSAEILDERDRESFAWKSNEGSDCAGLVTFHSLSDRLTRLELTLDVVPRDAVDSAVLLTHLAHRRARRELRRFKAELELVSPDVYDRDEGTSSR
jgi:uncharacterized membrane protein